MLLHRTVTPELESLFRTRDFRFAAYLIAAQKAELVGLVPFQREARRGRGRVDSLEHLFYFFLSPVGGAVLDAEELAYSNRKAVIEPLALCEQLGTLRRILFDSDSKLNAALAEEGK